MISCLTVTRDRLILLKEAIDCYLQQSYPRKELVILPTGSRRTQRAIADYLRPLDRSDVRLVVPESGVRNLAQARNLAIEAARGEVVCQWDDDDLYHHDRLRLQLEAMSEGNSHACFLTEVLQFFVEERALYWVDWRRYSDATPDQQLVPGTMMARRSAGLRYPEEGPDVDTGEDNALRTWLHRNGSVRGLEGKACLYLYRYHGANACPREHHLTMARNAAVAGAELESRYAELRRALCRYRLPLPLTLRGANGEPVWAYNGGS